jgi:hypothetical protein
MRAFLLVPLIAAAVLAQDTNEAPGGAYRAEFVIHDGSESGKTGRRFTLMLDSSGKGTMRSGARVPYASGPQQWQFVDVGVNIDCRVRHAGAKLGLSADLEVSTFVPGKPSEAPGGQPVTQQLRLSTSTTLTPGKPSTIVAVDDPATGRKVTIDATVTKLD